MARAVASEVCSEGAGTCEKSGPVAENKRPVFSHGPGAETEAPAVSRRVWPAPHSAKRSFHPALRPPQKLTERVVRRDPLSRGAIAAVVGALRLADLRGFDPQPENFVAAGSFCCLPPGAPPAQVGFLLEHLFM